MKKQVFLLVIGSILISIIFSLGVTPCQAQEAGQSEDTIQPQEADQAASEGTGQSDSTSVQMQEATQPQGTIQPQAGNQFPCDGTGQAGSIRGLRRSTSNCDREAAAARNAARRAAAAAGQASPDSAAPMQNQGGQK